MRGWPLCLLGTGCASVFGIGDPDVGGGASCAIGSFDLCATQNPAGPIQFTTDTVVFTDRDCSLVLFEPKVGSICVIYATEIDVAGSATVRAVGARPLVLAASGTISVAGAVDVSSYRDTGPGAGSDPPACMIEREPGTDANGASGGYPGGSFGGRGGAGGNGAGNTVGGIPGDPIAPPDYPRGGCPGGSSTGPIGGGDCGSGGGAVWLVAGDQISIASTGRVLAAGGGGRQGFGEGATGGCGGGSGGFLRVAAPTITISGLVMANGGGGSEGSDPNGTGMSGSDGAAPTNPSKGGKGGNAAGGDGGDGAVGTQLEGGPGLSAAAVMGAGGGGGGGGAGAIIFAAEALTTAGATISPPAM